MAREPVEKKDTIFADGYVAITDAIQEGKIKGLVSNDKGIFIDETSIQEFLTVDYAYPFTRTSFLEDVQFTNGEKNSNIQSLLQEDFSTVIYHIDAVTKSQLKKNNAYTVNIDAGIFPYINEIGVTISFNQLYLVWDDDLEALFKDEEYADEYDDYLLLKREGRVQQDVVRLAMRFVYNLYNESGVLIQSGVWSFSEKQQQAFDLKFIITPKDGQNWSNVKKFKLEIIRKTFDSTFTKIKSSCSIKNIVCKTDMKLRYPNTQVAGLKFLSKDFQQIPARGYLCDLKLVKVPVNYTPPEFDYDGNMTQTPSYNGVWNGTFKESWTNNPAWIFYDLATNKRYGAGNYLFENNIDKWTLYLIGQYCDAVNDNGAFVGVVGSNGNLEQRFTCNLYLTSQEEAFTVLNNLASVFRGMCYWNFHLISPVQDRRRKYVYQFNNQNVAEGDFNYLTSQVKEKPTVAVVRWNDPQDLYKAKIARYENQEAMLKYDVVEREVAAFGCTQETQALRAGKWLVDTELNEKEIVKFTVGYDGLICRPGDVIKIHDNNRQGKYAGRVLSMPTTSKIILDRNVDNLGQNSDWTIQLAIPKMSYDPVSQGQSDSITDSSYAKFIRTRQVEEKNVQSIVNSGSRCIIETQQNFSQVVEQSPWILTNKVLGISQEKLYRVLGITEKENFQFEITALEYFEGKYDESNIVQSQAQIDYQTYAIDPPSNLNLTLTQYEPAYIQATFQPSKKNFVASHLAQGKYDTDVVWTPLTINNNQIRVNYGGRDENYTISILAKQVGGKYSTEVQGSIYFYQTQNTQGQDWVLAAIEPVIENADSNNEYFTNQPLIQFKQSSYGVKPDYFNWRVLSGSSPLCEWQQGDINQLLYGTYQITSGQLINTIITGWPIRSCQIETEQFLLTKTASGRATFKNEYPYGNTFSVTNQTKNQFIYKITNQKSDFSGVYIEVGQGSGIADFSGNYTQLDAQVLHNLNNTGVWYNYYIYDTFKQDIFDTMSGWKQIQSAADLPAGFYVNAYVYQSQNSWKQQDKIEFVWPKQDNSQFYELEISQSNGEFYNFAVPNQGGITNENYFLFVNPEDEFSYSGRIRQIQSDGSASTYSNYCQPVYVSKMVMKNLETSGLYVSGYVNIKASGIIDINGDIIIQSNALIGKDLIVSGLQNFKKNAYFYEDIYVASGIVLSGELNVSGVTNLLNQTNILENFFVYGDSKLKNAYVSGLLNVSGLAIFEQDTIFRGTNWFSGVANFQSGLNVIGPLTLDGVLSNKIYEYQISSGIYELDLGKSNNYKIEFIHDSGDQIIIPINAKSGAYYNIGLMTQVSGVGTYDFSGFVYPSGNIEQSGIESGRSDMIQMVYDGLTYKQVYWTNFQ